MQRTLLFFFVIIIIWNKQIFRKKIIWKFIYLFRVIISFHLFQRKKKKCAILLRIKTKRLRAVIELDIRGHNDTGARNPMRADSFHWERRSACVPLNGNSSDTPMGVRFALWRSRARGRDTLKPRNEAAFHPREATERSAKEKGSRSAWRRRRRRRDRSLELSCTAQ